MRDYRSEPASHVVDGFGFRAAETKPGFLYCIVGFSERAQHAVGNCAQVIAALFEAFSEKFRFGHQSHFLDRIRHGIDERKTQDVTRRSNAIENESPSHDCPWSHGGSASGR